MAGDLQNGSGIDDHHPSLPLVSDSRSKLLSSTHVLEIHVLRSEYGPWVAENDGFQRRSVSVSARLSALFKGSVDREEGQDFQFQISQQREGGNVQSDFYGIWSHLDPVEGEDYLILSKCDEKKLGNVIKEPFCRDVYEAGLRSDVILAISCERSGDRPPLAGDLYQTAAEQYGSQGLFGEYVWERAKLQFEQEPELYIFDVLNIVKDGKHTLEFHDQFLDGVYRSVLTLEEKNEIRKQVIGAFFDLLRTSHFEQQKPNLVDIKLYNLIFKDDQPLFGVEEIFADSGKKRQIQECVAGIELERQREFMKWLGD